MSFPIALGMFFCSHVYAADSLQTTDKYVLGPGDRISIWVLGIEEFQTRILPVDDSGFIDAPLVGRIHVAGLTVTLVKNQLVSRFRSLVREPEVAVSIAEYHSQPVSVIGAVTRPGVHQLQGRPVRLAEMLSAAEGPRRDASNIVRITRRMEFGRIPLPEAFDDQSGEFSVVELSLRDILQGTNPLKNVALRPHDVVAVLNASTVYVLGEVKKPGGFVLENRKTVTILEAVGLAEGMSTLASPAKARILRSSSSSTDRTTINVDIKSIMEGRTNDVALHENDIVVIPDSKGKRAALRTLDSAISIASGITIWRVGLPR